MDEKSSYQPGTVVEVATDSAIRIFREGVLRLREAVEDVDVAGFGLGAILIERLRNRAAELRARSEKARGYARGHGEEGQRADVLDEQQAERYAFAAAEMEKLAKELETR